MKSCNALRVASIVGTATGSGAFVSAGVAASRPPHTPLPRLLEAADEALYKAKREGRDRVVAARKPGGARSQCGFVRYATRTSSGSPSSQYVRGKNP